MDDFLLNERTGAKDDQTEDDGQQLPADLAAEKDNDDVEKGVDGNKDVDGNKGVNGDSMPIDPAPLFMEQFNRLKTKVSPTERELRALSIANLNDDELKQIGGVGDDRNEDDAVRISLVSGEDFSIKSETESNFSNGNTSSAWSKDELGQVTENLTMIEMQEIFRERSCQGQDCPDNPYGDDVLNSSMYFNDGKRSVDFVLVWRREEASSNSKDDTKSEKREIFEENLMNEGLELEYEVIADEFHFVKVHAPVEVLRRYAEILKLRMPMKESLCKIQKPVTSQSSTILNAAQYITRKIPGVNQGSSTMVEVIKRKWKSLLSNIYVEEKTFPKRSHRFTAIYSRDKEYLFDLSQTNFFTSAVRSRIVQFILDRKRFSRDFKHDFAFGIERLISEHVYNAAYPLHDGEVHIPGSMRYKLYHKWASVRKWFRYQPLDYIREYFGVKIGLYFAWLGYYTYMLMLASAVGLLCFIYSLKTIDTYPVAKEVCDKGSQIIMCPICDVFCDYWKLSETCTYTKVSYLVDNTSTVWFAIFMSFWATLFLEMWKRYSAEITHRWDLTGFDVHEEHPRPQYLARLANVRKKRLNTVTNTEEPQVPFWRMKLPATLFSTSVVILLILLAFAAVVSVVIYRISVMTAIGWNKKENKSWVMLFTSITAASINLTLIVILNRLYTKLAKVMTEYELLRTQTEFDDSLTLKIYLLQFVNYYSSIFYIAFFKGKFIGHPGGYNRVGKYRQEECGPSGCFMDLTIQLAIIMVGKQGLNTVKEMVEPKIMKWYNSFTARIGARKRPLKGQGERWIRDYKLVEWGPRSLFYEYLEMVLQYGFVTIFVSAFPLAPLFALLNNILEMRLDAKKLLIYHRRPVSQRVRDIGIWYRILDSIGKLSVITNGFIIAFTSDFIPRLVYRFTYENSLNGYLNFTLSSFNTSNFDTDSRPIDTDFPGVEVCRYKDYRDAQYPYDRTKMFWIILACRLAFVVIFENIVAVVMILVRWCIPDMSRELRDQIRREAYITNEIIIKQETMRAKEERRYGLHHRHPLNRQAAFLQFERMASSNMTGSELDLEMHYDNFHPTRVETGDHPKNEHTFL